MSESTPSAFSLDWFLKVSEDTNFGREYRQLHDIPQSEEFFKQVQVWRCDREMVTVKVGPRSWAVDTGTLVHRNELPDGMCVELLTGEERRRMSDEIR